MFRSFAKQEAQQGKDTSLFVIATEVPRVYTTYNRVQKGWYTVVLFANNYNTLLRSTQITT